MTTHRPTPMDRAPSDPTAPLLGPGQWHVNAPSFGRGEVPAHVALIMDGNGRWANSRGLTRTEGHRAGEYALMDTIAGAIDAGVRYLSVYTFSTENWKRSPAEVSFIMNYASDVLARRTDQLAQWGVHVRWSTYTFAMIPGCVLWALLYGLGMLAVFAAAIRAIAGSPWGWAGLAILIGLITAKVVWGRRKRAAVDRSLAEDRN